MDRKTENPYALFKSWLTLAEKKEPNDPSAVCLATCNSEGMPNARMVLMKDYDEDGFVFYTNLESEKGQELADNPRAAMCFHWKTLRKQVRIRGDIEPVSAEQADEYFRSRHRSSQIGAWASRQSKPLEGMEELEKFVAAYEKEFSEKNDVPRPENWSGFRLKPHTIEFWIDGNYRLHERFLFTRRPDGEWESGMLYP